MTITPDEARDQLDGATPGPWTLGASPFEVWSVVPTDLGPDHGNLLGTFATEEDADLACTAPDLAHTIAGMRWQIGVHAGDEDIWAETPEEEALAVMAGKRPEVRLIRRLVGPVEEA